MRKTLFAGALVLLSSLAAMATSPSGHGGSHMSEFKLHKRATETNSCRSNLTYFKDLTSSEQKKQLARKGIYVTNSFESYAAKIEESGSLKSPIREGDETYTVTVNLEYDEGEVMEIMSGKAFLNGDTKESYSFEYTEDIESDYIEFILPKGNYDIVVVLETYPLDIILLSEQNVEITGDTTVTLDTKDATEEITWNPLMPDGTTPVQDMPVYDPETFEIVETVPGNALYVPTMFEVYNKRYKHNNILFVDFGNFYIGDNKISVGEFNVRFMPNDDYVFHYYKGAISNDGGFLISLTADASETQTVTNNTENYITMSPQYATALYHPDPLVLDVNGEEIIYEFDQDKSFSLIYESVSDGELNGQAHFALISRNEFIKKDIHVCQDPNISNEFMVMAMPGLVGNWQTDMSMNGLPINSELSTPMLLGMNNFTDLSKYLKLPEEREIYLSKSTNPWLSFDITKPHVWNYGCPILLFATSGSIWGSFFDFAYIGGLGERRDTDLLLTKASVAVNDDVPSEEVLENLQWGVLPAEGKINFEFTNFNVVVDDIIGKNVTRIGFDMSRSDWMPPTLQIVRFVDRDNNFTDRYAKGDEGILEFYGGDFIHNYVLEPLNEWYTEKPAANVLVEYAPYGTEAFLPLEVENVAERDFMPGFGTYYRGSLAGVDRKSENGWFDVRITLTDAAGNFQQQTLSPAFKIDESVGVEAISSPEIAVAVANGKIKVCGCENPVIEVYSTDGVLLRRSMTSSVEASELNHGIYLINITDGSKRVVRKLHI